jgi:hypothetical protein
VDAEIQVALRAAQPHPVVLEHVQRAVALAAGTVPDPTYGPVVAEPLSNGPATSLTVALRALQVELVRAKHLRAAGSLQLAHQAALAAHSPGFGLVLAPPRHMWGLAGGLGKRLEDLGLPMMGSLVTSDLSATFRWDIHHEEPVRTAYELGPRELISYRVSFPHGRAACEALLPDGEWFFVRDPFVLEWYAEQPDWALPAPEPGRAQALAERLRTAETLDETEFEFRPPISARELAAALGAPDAFARTVDVHMSHWQLVLPPIGAWTLHASLDGPATGERLSGDFPAAAARRLGEDDLVRRLTVLKS